MPTLTEQLTRLLALEPDWDGAGAAAVTPHLAGLAKESVETLRAQEKAAGRDIGLTVRASGTGGVRLAWADAKREHELELHPDGSFGTTHTDRATGNKSAVLFVVDDEGEDGDGIGAGAVGATSGSGRVRADSWRAKGRARRR